MGGRRLESRVQRGDPIAEDHLRAWRIAREEVLANVMRWVRLVIANYNAYTGKVIHEDRLLHARLPDELWERLRNFLESLSRVALLDRPQLQHDSLRAEAEPRLLGEGFPDRASPRRGSRFWLRRSI